MSCFLEYNFEVLCALDIDLLSEMDIVYLCVSGGPCACQASVLPQSSSSTLSITDTGTTLVRPHKTQFCSLGD